MRDRGRPSGRAGDLQRPKPANGPRLPRRRAIPRRVAGQPIQNRGNTSMKKVLLASASVAALFIAAPAMADPGDNSSTVTQSGDTQNATVNQTGSNDVST